MGTNCIVTIGNMLVLIPVLLKIALDLKVVSLKFPLLMSYGTFLVHLLRACSSNKLQLDKVIEFSDQKDKLFVAITAGMVIESRIATWYSQPQQPSIH